MRIIQDVPKLVIQFFATAEGYYDFKNSKYIYQYKDHLGNVRVSYAKATKGVQVIDRNDYYAFGMNHANMDASAYFWSRR